MRLVPSDRQILPVVYRRLTIPRHPWRYSRDAFRIPATEAQGAKVKLMRIYGSNAAGKVANASAPRRTASGGFTVDEGEAPQSAQPAASLRTIGGIDALLALQGEDDPAERKRRAVKRGRTALDGGPLSAAAPPRASQPANG